ncbi:MAG TPA: gamma carbonic anhydrase family protein [Methanomicrobiales archaeon]|nr:gamma carbonic anhydrase family protein [Methanomicrobiales archaeon]
MAGGGTGAAGFIAPSATVIGDVTLGEDTGIWFGAVIRGDRDRIEIGAGSNIQDNAVVHTSRGFPARIGREVSVGHGAVLHGCTIRDRVLVGMGAIVMNGAEIGEDSIIAAGAVVTEGTAIPPGSVVMGVPARVVKQASPEQKAGIRRNAESYVALAREYRNG